MKMPFIMLKLATLKKGYAEINPSLRKRLKFVSVLLIAILALLILTLPTYQGIKIFKERLAQRPSQLAEIQGVIKQNQLLKDKNKSAPALTELEIQKIRQAFQAREIKPTIFQLDVEKTTTVIQIQLTQASYSSVLDVLDALRSGWHMSPTKLEASSGSTPGLVNVSMTLEQIR